LVQAPVGAVGVIDRLAGRVFQGEQQAAAVGAAVGVLGAQGQVGDNASVFLELVDQLAHAVMDILHLIDQVVRVGGNHVHRNNVLNYFYVRKFPA
jgi:hypothetical protein